MGMFDYIRCEMPLPKTPIMPTCKAFQTKDTPDQYMTTYTIRADGHIVYRPFHMEDVPKSERPYPDAPDNSALSLAGSWRRVEHDEERLYWDEDIVFYDYDSGTGAWWEYRAIFTDGVCVGIDLVAFEHKGAKP